MSGASLGTGTPNALGIKNTMLYTSLTLALWRCSGGGAQVHQKPGNSNAQRFFRHASVVGPIFHPTLTNKTFIYMPSDMYIIPTTCFVSAVRLPPHNPRTHRAHNTQHIATRDTQHTTHTQYTHHVTQHRSTQTYHTIHNT